MKLEITDQTIGVTHSTEVYLKHEATTQHSQEDS